MAKPVNRRIGRYAVTARAWVDSVLDPTRLRSIHRYSFFLKDLLRYRRLEGAEPIRLADTQPCLRDKTYTTPCDAHYFYQDVWAFRRIFASRTLYHIDIGSRADFVGMLSAVTRVVFVDIRPLKVRVEGFQSVTGSLLQLPFADRSLPSISCLHVAEHIGLGRYGDPLDPHGTRKAARELARVLAPAGSLYFSLPIGRPRVCFNAHRIHSARTILAQFESLKLAEFCAIADDGQFMTNADIRSFEDCRYACGLFWFKKPDS